MSEHGLRCACDDCIAERDLVRTRALASLAGKGWAGTSWDGPLANFPGADGNDDASSRDDD